MFFSFCPWQDDRFPEHKLINDQWWFNHDKGWQQTDAGWIKGYRYDQLDHGNHCEVTIDQNSDIHIKHDIDRSFPLWWDESRQVLTNLLGTGENIWCDDVVKLTTNGLYKTKQNIYGITNQSSIDYDTLITALYNNLHAKIIQFKQDSTQKKLFLSGGIDTLILLAMARSVDLDVEILDYDHFEYDKFLDLNLEHIKARHWGYKQMHHWQQDCFLMTGACGDEFFMRGPNTLSIWCAWHGICIEALLSKNDGYHTKYFQLDKNLSIFKQNYLNQDRIRDLYPTKKDLIRQILHINANDHQHWHLGNTLTWTPFKDLELSRLCMALDAEEFVDHMINATISKKLLCKFDASCVQFLSTYKNLDRRQNLYKLFGY